MRQPVRDRHPGRTTGSSCWCTSVASTPPKPSATAATALAQLPPQIRSTLTWDQGKEMAQHRQIADATGTGVYFCDAHSPWQRGSNEDMNGLLRQYFPQGRATFIGRNNAYLWR